MYIKTRGPRTDLVKGLARQVKDHLMSHSNTVEEFLREIALVRQDGTLPECIAPISQGELIVVMHNQESASKLLAHILLRHYIGWEFYSEEMRDVFEEEVQLFCSIVESNINTSTAC